MKVGFLAGTLGRGVAEKQLTLMLQALHGEGIETRVLCLTKGEAYENEIRDLGIDVDWIGGSENRLIRLGNLISNLRRSPVDVIQSVHFYTNIYVGIAGRVLRTPNLGAIRNDLLSEIAANGNFGKWQLKLPQRLVANSRLAVDRAINCGIRPSKIEFVRNAVETKNGANGSKQKPKTCLTILFAGRLVPQKRPEVFIKLAEVLGQRFPNINLEFLIAGDGPLRPEIEKLSCKKGASQPILKFLGEEADMPVIYRKADILVLTSVHEGTPNVILEAMSHGIPVVATKVGGVPEILAEGYGIMVDRDDFGELCAATSKLVLNTDLRNQMGQQAQEYVRKNHSIGYLQEELKSIYSGLLQQRGASTND